MTNIPQVDLHDFTQGNEQKRQAFVKQLGEAFNQVGFVAVKNHGLAPELEQKLYQEVKAFFHLPEATKRQYEIPELFGQRGYVSFGKEHAKGRSAGDLKEFWHFGQALDSKTMNLLGYPENVRVSECPNFNEVGNQVFKTLENSGLELLKAIALYLGLEEDYFEDKTRGGNSILRPIHYPPITSEPSSAVRAAEHEDINLITLLMGASADGLEILSKQNQWVPVTALPDQIVVNVGDMLQRLTNNRLKSTTHRVVNPPREAWSQSRFSIPFFLHPKSEMDLTCLSQCIPDGEQAAYSSITAGEYLDERLREIGLKK